MPVSRQRITAKIKAGKSGGRNTYSKADIFKINEACTKKFEHYQQYDLAQLEAIRDSKAEKGTYLHALLQVIELKKNPPKKSALEESEKTEEIIENTINQ